MASSAANSPRAVSTVARRVPSGSSREVGVDTSGLCGRLGADLAAAAGAPPATATRSGGGRAVAGGVPRVRVGGIAAARGRRAAGGLPGPRPASRPSAVALRTAAALGPGLAGLAEVLFDLGREPGPRASQ